MRLRVYSMYDRKARGFGALMNFVNDEIARRAVLAIVRGDGEIKNFPGDFDMYCLGEMDSETGVLDAGIPTPVFNVGDLIKAAQQEN